MEPLLWYTTSQSRDLTLTTHIQLSEPEPMLIRLFMGNTYQISVWLHSNEMPRNVHYQIVVVNSTCSGQLLICPHDEVRVDVCTSRLHGFRISEGLVWKAIGNVLKFLFGAESCHASFTFDIIDNLYLFIGDWYEQTEWWGQPLPRMFCTKYSCYTIHFAST